MKNFLIRKIFSKKTAFFVFSFCFFSFFFSCSNGNEIEEKSSGLISGTKFIVSGKAEVSASCGISGFSGNSECSGFSESSARTALPSASGMKYFVTAQLSSASGGPQIKSADFDLGNDFSISLSAGTWNFSASAYYSDDAKKTAVISGSSKNIVVSNADVSGISILLDSPNSSSGSGTVSLLLKADSSVKTAEASWSVTTVSDGNSITSDYEKTIAFSGADSSSVFDLIPDSSSSGAEIYKNVPAGKYVVKFQFKDNSNSLLYSCTETINVFKGMKTDSWSGNSEYIDEAGNVLCISSDVIKNFALRTFFVDSVSGADGNSGTFHAPLKTLGKAFEKVENANDGESKFYIYLTNNIISNGDTSGLVDESLFSIKDTSKRLNLTVSGLSDSAVEIDAARVSRIFYISGNVNLVLENLNLYGGYVNTNGGAIYLNGEAGAELELLNCVIGKSNDEIENLQDGIQNKSYSPNEQNCSNCAAEGGGIFAENGAGLSLKSTKILNCFAKSAYSGGGGISIKNKTIMSIDENSEIYANGAQGSNGVALYAEKSEIYFSSGTVRHNYSDAAGKVPGIYLKESTLDISENVEIRDNYCSKSCFGAGIYIGDADSSVSFYGGSVLNNSSVEEKNQTCDVGYSVSMANPVLHLSEEAYIETIYSPKNSIEILDTLSGFSAEKMCRIFTETAEGKEVLLANTDTIPLEDFVDFFKIFDTNLNELKGMRLSVDSSGGKKVAKIAKSFASVSSFSSYSDLSSAADSGEKTFSISTEAELRQISAWTQSYGNSFSDITLVLEKDIHLNCYKDDSSTYFTPIGVNSPFRGIFDGKGHEISNLYVESADKAGLFSNIYGGTIKNLSVEGTVSGTSSGSSDGKTGVGGIVGYSTSEILIENCVSKVNVKSACANTGGICGFVNETSVIRNCINLGEISSSAENVGGISGNPYTVYNSANFGSVSGKSNVAGIAGSTESNVTLCYNVGKISSADENSAAAIANISGSVSDKTFYTNCYYKTGTAGVAFTGVSVSTRNFDNPKSIDLNLELNNNLNNFAQKEFCKRWDKTYVFGSVEYPVCIEIK